MRIKQDEPLPQKFACVQLTHADETGVDCRHTSRKHGYSIRERHSIIQQLLVRELRISALSVISTNDLLDAQILKLQMLIISVIFFNHVLQNLANAI